MKKIFISQPFSGRTEEEIFKQRGEIISYLKSVIGDEELYVFDQYHQTEAPPESGSLYYLGNDIHMMSLADLIVFSSDWHSAHGCRVERFVAQEYGFAMIEVPGDTKDKTKPEEKILEVVGETDIIHDFVKELSQRIGHECDFSFVIGSNHRAQIIIPNDKDAIVRATSAYYDEDWMEQFHFPFMAKYF